MMRFFRVTPPTVHQMVLALERAGLICRQPGVPRSIVVLLDRSALPELNPAMPNRSKYRQHRFDDGRIGAAAAEVPANGGLHVLSCKFRRAFQQGVTHDHAGGAISALHRVIRDENLAHRVRMREAIGGPSSQTAQAAVTTDDWCR